MPDFINISPYSAILLAGGFTLIGALLGSLVTHRLAVTRTRKGTVSEISKALLGEISSIEAEMNTVRTFSSPLEAIGYARRFELGSVNFIAFKKTCAKRAQEKLQIAYDDYKTSNNKYDSLINLKSVVENIVNERAI
jgi:hypothetical protein